MATLRSLGSGLAAFPEIGSPPGGIFDYGIAYPIRATIEGTGVGAIRRCTFNTGDFVEPITAWEAPRRLAFDVVENPLPMKEWSFWGEIDTPHLHGFMVSERGQFRLTEQPDGTVLLEGTTWYHQNLWPNTYWGTVSDQIIMNSTGGFWGTSKTWWKIRRDRHKRKFTANTERHCLSRPHPTRRKRRDVRGPSRDSKERGTVLKSASPTPTIPVTPGEPGLGYPRQLDSPKERRIPEPGMRR